MPSHAGTWYLAVLVLAFLAPLSTRGDDPKKQPMPDPFGWEEPLALHRRGDREWVGRFDDNGNFIPEPTLTSIRRAPFSGPLSYWPAGGLNINTVKYEHRSDRFIRGMMVKSGLFVPEIGSKVLDRNAVYLDKLDAMVWNLRESQAAFWTPEREKQFPRGLPSEPDPPQAGVPKGWEVVPLQKAWPDWLGRCARVIGDMVEFGRLSPEGEFLPAEDLPIVSLSGIKTPILVSAGNPWYYTLPRIDKGRKQTSELVYEYRSGRLIKGRLQESGNFVPEVGSTILDFKDYDPESGAGGSQRNEKGEEVRRFGLRIYNLPGELRRVK